MEMEISDVSNSFNIANDWKESKNLAEIHPQQVQNMLAKLEKAAASDRDSVAKSRTTKTTIRVSRCYCDHLRQSAISCHTAKHPGEDSNRRKNPRENRSF